MPFDGTYFARSAVADALMSGKAQIERGWCQGAARTRDGVCLVGALHNVCATQRAYTDAMLILVKAVRDKAPAFIGLAEFNDTPGRTRDEIIAVYDRAIELALTA